MFRSRLTPAVRKELVKCIELGVPPNRAASAVGICNRTFERWRDRGEKERNSGDGGNGGIYVALVNELDRAEGKFVKRNVERIEKGAEKDTEDAKWLLERRDRDNFAKTVDVVVGPSKVLLALQESSRQAMLLPSVSAVPLIEEVTQGS